MSVKTGSAAGRPVLDVSVDPPVGQIRQKSTLVCWAAAGAMLSNWKKRQSATVEAVLDDLGGDWRRRYELNLPLTVAELRAFFTALGLTEDGPVSYAPGGLARLVETVGDGTPDGTKVSIADPASDTPGTETFRAFDLLHTGADPVALLVGVFHL